MDRGFLGFESGPLHRLRGRERVLIAGAGGGFDVLSGLPIALSLLERGQQVILANLTFTAVTRTAAVEVGPGVFEARADSGGAQRYFPEQHLAEWLGGRSMSR
ncbi:hypothetical protein KHQ06_31225 [Nocardia tengchongensis]|uniref:DUF1152 domain-containing protein n=1 Tax=Nocardia tengchongensis TaxID=2055889 RepID=A0ABX8CKW5_9NOCA|nr:hypothetical protein [Nocardia tengchongensis]QVI20570.1 hypothetical protein KHQ06_31225 [Nocardia tengchongensis]